MRCGIVRAFVLAKCLLDVLVTYGRCETVLITDGKANGAIVISSSAHEVIKDAASKLQMWLKEATGCEVPIKEPPHDGDAVWLSLSSDAPNLAKAHKTAELGDEGFAVVTLGKRTYVLANTPLGIRHGVYALLEHIGFRWFFPDPIWTIVPKLKSVTLKMSERQKPAFAYRRIWYEWGATTKRLRENYEAWMERNRQYGNFQVDCGHAYERFVSHRLFNDHPEYFALVGGVRKPAQICITNPEVVQLGIDYALNAFRKRPELNMVSVEPNDGGGYCECQNCRSIGNPSEMTFHYANTIARALRKEFPNKFVGLYAYAYHSDPPKFKLEPNVYVQVTTGFRYTKLSFEEQVEAFRRLGAKVGVYDYFSVYPWSWDMPGTAKASRIYELAQSIKRYYELGLTTLDAESECNWAPCGVGYYIASKLMWNPELDPKELIADFCRRSFGRAEKPMRRLIERWAVGERFSQRTLALALRDVNEAFSLEDEPQCQERIAFFGLYLHWLKLWHRYHRLSQRTEFGKLIVDPKAVIDAAHDWVVFSRRIYELGIVHTYPMLFTEWFNARLSSLLRIEGVTKEMLDTWRNERTDIPTLDEAKESVRLDLEEFKDEVVVELSWKSYSDELVPLVERMPQLKEAYANVKRSPLFVEMGAHYFLGKAGEEIEVSLKPQPGHTILGHWKLIEALSGKVISEGDIKCEKPNEPASIKLKLPKSGLYCIEPPTGYWHVAELNFGGRCVSVRADRKKQMQLWTPSINTPLYFYVPKGTKSFVIGVVGGGWPKTRIILRDGDNKVIADRELMPTDELSVLVPNGSDGQVWSIAISTLRGIFEFYDVPPYLAAHPCELLVPKDAL
ncbi:MAG: hypothetical protein GDYSWBUE_000975 [Candidatus Fervidibacterota bacterium]